MNAVVEDFVLACVWVKCHSKYVLTQSSHCESIDTVPMPGFQTS